MLPLKNHVILETVYMPAQELLKEEYLCCAEIKNPGEVPGLAKGDTVMILKGRQIYHDRGIFIHSDHLVLLMEG